MRVFLPTSILFSLLILQATYCFPPRPDCLLSREGLSPGDLSRVTSATCPLLLRLASQILPSELPFQIPLSFSQQSRQILPALTPIFLSLAPNNSLPLASNISLPLAPNNSLPLAFHLPPILSITLHPSELGLLILSIAAAGV